MHRVNHEPRRFYDGGVPPRDGAPAQPPAPGREPQIVLERHTDDGPERFSLERRLAYLDRHLGELLVPADDSFRTDLTSTPRLFTWLVPTTGAHLPAALLHDGLVQDDGSAGLSYASTEGHDIDRVSADRVFRDAMADTGTGVVRRWIVWAAVTFASFFVGARTPWSPVLRWRYRLAAAASVSLVVWLGWSATADLFDVEWPLAPQVPWMPEGPFLAELFSGLAGALVIPFVLALTWGRFWRAGAICLVVLAVLLHVTVALAAITLVYQAAEWVAARLPGGTTQPGGKDHSTRWEGPLNAGSRWPGRPRRSG